MGFFLIGVFMLASICFITAHLNPANHFAKYVEVYERAGIPCTVIAAADVSEKFSHLESKVHTIDFSSEESLLSFVERRLEGVKLIIADIGHERWGELFYDLSKRNPLITRVAYYDNPEEYVSGGYSEVAEKVITQAQVVLFANQALVEKGIQKEKGIPIDLSEKGLLGVGYYPQDEADKILSLKRDTERLQEVRKGLFARQETEDTGQRIIAYIGGANEAYYEKAFPSFVELLSQVDPSCLENTVFVLQQHPRAKKEGNLDVEVLGRLPSSVRFIVSDISTIEALAISDGAFYYQTSMGAQFVLGGIPLVAQVGHEVYPDMLIRAGFPSITTKSELEEALTKKAERGNLQLLEKELGKDSNWKQNLLEL
jgi:hypothetical protein